MPHFLADADLPFRVALAPVEPLQPESQMTDHLDRSSRLAFSPPFLWPLMMAASASAAATSFLNSVARPWLQTVGELEDTTEPLWSTDNSVALELSSMRLRDFSTRAHGHATLVCAPYALHEATIADFAPGHSVVQALRRAGLSRVFVTDWRSATREMRFFSIDNYLADLNVAVDELKLPVDLVGLCQGGWLALVYAARFPDKVRRLVLVGAPIDVQAAESHLSRAVGNTPLSAFETLVRLGEGRVLGGHVLDAWASVLSADEADRVLQVSRDSDAKSLPDLEARFRKWYASTVNLPGPYYLQAVDCLYKQNQIAKGEFVALGRRIDLADVRSPLFLLAARDDELVAAGQVLAAARLVGSSKSMVETAVEPCGHLGRFLGARTLAGSWTRIARWLGDSRTVAMAS